MAEWLRRLTRNQIPSGSVGSSPTDREMWITFCLFDKVSPAFLTFCFLSNKASSTPKTCPSKVLNIFNQRLDPSIHYSY